jgi:hypothetical protein
MDAVGWLVLNVKIVKIYIRKLIIAFSFLVSVSIPTFL